MKTTYFTTEELESTPFKQQIEISRDQIKVGQIQFKIIRMLFYNIIRIINKN